MGSGCAQPLPGHKEPGLHHGSGPACCGVKRTQQGCSVCVGVPQSPGPSLSPCLSCAAAMPMPSLAASPAGPWLGLTAAPAPRSELLQTTSSQSAAFPPRRMTSAVKSVSCFVFLGVRNGEGSAQQGWLEGGWAGCKGWLLHVTVAPAEQEQP